MTDELCGMSKMYITNVYSLNIITVVQMRMLPVLLSTFPRSYHRD